jgi:hypothetical protein
VPLFVVDAAVVGAQVVTITVGVSAQSRQREAMIVLLQPDEEGLGGADTCRPLETGQVKDAGQLVTVAVAKTVNVLRGNGEQVECVKVIVLTLAHVMQGSVDV